MSPVNDRQLIAVFVALVAIISLYFFVEYVETQTKLDQVVMTCKENK